MNRFHFQRERAALAQSRRYASRQSGQRTRRSRFTGSLSVLLAFALALPVVATSEPKTADPPVRVVNMLAERFFFVPSRLKVKQGTTVEFRIRSADTNHGFRIRKAGINIVVPKRGKGRAKVIFHARKRAAMISNARNRVERAITSCAARSSWSNR